MADNFTEKGVMLAVGILVVGILIAFLLPMVITGVSDPVSSTYNQTEGETITVTNKLNSTLDNVSQASSEVTVTLNHTGEETATKTVTVGVGSNTTVSMPDGDVVVTAESIHDSTHADITYEYPQEYGWNDGAGGLYNLLPLMFVLAAVMLVVGKAMSYT